MDEEGFDEEKGGGRRQGHYDLKLFIMAYSKDFVLWSVIFRIMNFAVAYFKNRNFAVACI